MRIDAPGRKIKRDEIICLRNNLRNRDLCAYDSEKFNNQLFRMVKDFPLVEVERCEVFGPDRNPVPGMLIWAYEYRFQYTHMDEDGDWWLLPGHEIKEGQYENLDGTVLLEERPDYLRIFENAEWIRRRMLATTLLHLKQVETVVENDMMNYGWAATITDVDGRELSHEIADEAPRSIVSAVLSVLLEYPERGRGIDLID